MSPDQPLLSQAGPSAGDRLQPLAALEPSLGFWIYGLPGSRLGLLRSAGAPALESLARGDHLGEDWRAWIFYGPPDQALAELADQGSSPKSAGGSLLAWQQTMELAVQVKRQGRERLQLVNLGHATPALEEALRRELPELEQNVRRLRSSRVSNLPEDVLQATTHALLQLRPSLLNAYLDLESWADRFGRDGDGALWRQSIDGGELLQALRRWDVHHGALGARDSRLVALERQLSRDREERDLLLAHLHQLEVELDHYVAEHERLAELVGRVESQMGRARQLLRHVERANAARASAGVV
jgi:hypothetical protein